MTSRSSTTAATVRVAIDVAKLTHQVLLELPNGKRRVIRVANTKADLDHLVATLRALDHPCEVAFEPTGDYHRPLAYLLGQAGCQLRFVSTLAVARTREALYNTWDKNDPKDAQVILHLLKQGTTQTYLDPLVTGHHDLQEVANTYQQISLRKVRLHHSLLTLLAAVLPGSGALPAQFARRVVHRAVAVYAVSGGRAPLHEGGLCRRRHGARGRPQGR